MLHQIQSGMLILVCHTFAVATCLAKGYFGFTGPGYVFDPATKRETEAQGKFYTERAQDSPRPLLPSLSPAWSPPEQSCAPRRPPTLRSPL